MAERTPDLSRLFRDPPIRDRLTWRGLLRPEAHESRDPAVTASAFGAMYAAGSISGLLLLSVGDTVFEDETATALACVAGLILSLICLIGYRRLPRASFHLIALAGTGLITLVTATSADGSEATFAPLFSFIAIVSLLLFRLRYGVVHAVIAVGVFTGLVIAKDTEFATHLIVAEVAVTAALGLIVSVLRTRSRTIESELGEEAYSDELTGLANRRRFDERLRLELGRLERKPAPLSLIICDLDHFKRINDKFGHPAGDVVLSRVARAIGGAVRGTDLAARVGGEEFGVILPDAGPDAAIAAAERIRAAVAAELEGEEFATTISCGASTALPPSDDPGAIFGRADEALYAAKKGGRNRTAVNRSGQIEVLGPQGPLGRLRQLL